MSHPRRMAANRVFEVRYGLAYLFRAMLLDSRGSQGVMHEIQDYSGRPGIERFGRGSRTSRLADSHLRLIHQGWQRR
jgi:hypothetical protein